VEIGSGYSTLLACQALERNGFGTLECVEPFPMEFVTELEKEGRIRLRPSKVQEVDESVFLTLQQNDMLFVDSSHVCKIGSDVNHEIFNILPKLAKGVIIHFHDVFHPYDYPRSWVVDKQIFWSEQYLLMAFLAYNDAFRILLCNQYVARSLRVEAEKMFYTRPTDYAQVGGGSLWIEKLK
jgi:hypothetical protein